MFGFMSKPKKQNLVNPDSNPFDSDDESKQNLKGRRTSSEPVLVTPNFNDNPRGGSSASSSPYVGSAGSKDKYKNDFRDSGGLENQSVQELENYAVYKSEETTKTVNSCLKIAEDIREDATKTLETLHLQGEQITRTHMMVANTEQDLSKGEKLLGSLGGMFSMPWKPKKGKAITGPTITNDAASNRKQHNPEQREKLGLAPAAKGKGAKTPPPEPTNAMQKIELEKSKQDDALSDLSNILGDLKGMAVEMGTELERQNKALDHLSDDIDELNSRMKGANQRARRLVGK
ncbi:hypothetical protein RJ641_003111 [Dillenia turbinata]|uniref:t-SNARE coiled-coil homology domain-containing protein n=1 Tax=Dillenia turbinata TaxID=194707 RepID=A0AAN8VP83_9MAGN